ncbi:MAG: sporulation protein [Chloroflexi bacterium]|nr:sporulation protein [Chloroflexota bacterium]
MFDFMKGGKTALKLSLDRPVEGGFSATPYYLGETVRAKLTLTSEKEIKIQEGRIALVYHEEYQYRREVQRTDSQGHRRMSVETQWETDERELNRQVFLGASTIQAGNQTFDFELPIPVDAAPSASADIVKIEWIVKATLDRRMAGDIEDKVVIPVYAAAPARPASVGVRGACSEPGEADLAISLSKVEWMMGETVAGQLQISPKKEFDVTEIRVELMQRQSVPRDQGHQHEATIAAKLSGGTKLVTGQNLTLPFNIRIPVPAPATLTTPHGTLRWWLRGVLSRRLRKDTYIEEEIFVYNGPGPK